VRRRTSTRAVSVLEGQGSWQVVGLRWQLNPLSRTPSRAGGRTCPPTRSGQPLIDLSKIRSWGLSPSVDIILRRTVSHNAIRAAGRGPRTDPPDRADWRGRRGSARAGTPRVRSQNGGRSPDPERVIRGGLPVATKARLDAPAQRSTHRQHRIGTDGAYASVGAFRGPAPSRAVRLFGRGSVWRARTEALALGCALALTRPSGTREEMTR
jgi:hypothetical protein